MTGFDIEARHFFRGRVTVCRLFLSDLRARRIFAREDRSSADRSLPAGRFSAADHSSPEVRIAEADRSWVVPASAAGRTAAAAVAMANRISARLGPAAERTAVSCPFEEERKSAAHP
jgi:hypothetical protein